MQNKAFHLKRILLLDLFLLLFSTGAAAQGDMISYLLSLARGQGKILWCAKPVNKVLADPAVPDSIKARLQLALEIRRFAFDSLLLTENRNYTTYYDQHNEPLLWVVTACEKYALRPKTWKFPITGEVSYKGFFSREAAEQEERELQAQGYDTRIREVNAWSTLGKLRDPILSSMLEGSEGDLANVLIHELSHGTVFIPGDTEESENLANFIGDKGAYLFLASKYGTNSYQYLSYRHEQEDYELLAKAMLKGATRLDSLYQNITELPDDEKELKKNTLILEILSGLNDVPFHNADAFSGLRNPRRIPNNALFINFLQYNNKQDKYALEFEQLAGGDLKTFIQILIDRYR